MLKGLYIHIPFCSRFCTFCDFFKIIGNKETIDSYINALVKDINTKKKDYDTIYIGGGTPSIIGVDNFEKIFKSLKLDCLEFTIECNPVDITYELLDLFKKYNVTRISLGVQTFNDSILKEIKRDHNKFIALSAINKIKEYPFVLNIDMLYSLPNQTMVNLDKDLRILKEIKPNSISYYSLILEENTNLYYKYTKNKFKVNDVLNFKMYTHVEKYLTRLKYKKYENSNFSLNHESIHNKIYWSNDDYYSSGAGSVAKFESTRYTVVKNVKEFIRRINEFENIYEEVEELTLKDKMFEEIMMNLRYYKGLSISKFYDKYNKDVFSVFRSLEKLKKKRLIELTTNRIRLTKKGYLLQNYCLVCLLEDLENE